MLDNYINYLHIGKSKIFKKNSKLKIKKINLFFGLNGIGKSTLAKELVYPWSISENNINYLTGTSLNTKLKYNDEVAILGFKVKGHRPYRNDLPKEYKKFLIESRKVETFLASIEEIKKCFKTTYNDFNSLYKEQTGVYEEHGTDFLDIFLNKETLVRHLINKKICFCKKNIDNIATFIISSFVFLNKSAAFAKIEKHNEKQKTKINLIENICNCFEKNKIKMKTKKWTYYLSLNLKQLEYILLFQLSKTKIHNLKIQEIPKIYNNPLATLQKYKKQSLNDRKFIQSIDEKQNKMLKMLNLNNKYESVNSFFLNKNKTFPKPSTAESKMFGLIKLVLNISYSNKKHNIIIMDDPVDSMDEDYIIPAAEFIHRMQENVDSITKGKKNKKQIQLIIMTHSNSFLKRISFKHQKKNKTKIQNLKDKVITFYKMEVDNSKTKFIQSTDELLNFKWTKVHNLIKKIKTYKKPNANLDYIIFDLRRITELYVDIFSKENSESKSRDVFLKFLFNDILEKNNIQKKEEFKLKLKFLQDFCHYDTEKDSMSYRNHQMAIIEYFHDIYSKRFPGSWK